MPNRPPPEEKQFDEEVEEIVESASEDEDEDMEPATIPPANTASQSQAATTATAPHPTVANPVNAVRTPSEDVEMADTSAIVPNEVEEGSEEDDGLFAGGEESGADEPMEEVTTVTEEQADGLKRKLVEEDDYD